MRLSLCTTFLHLADSVGLDLYTRSYCLRRLRVEGIKFLTCTLPRLSKAVLRSLELGYFERPTDFAWKRRSLRYFGSFLNKIFDPQTGKVFDQPCAVSLLQLRHICEYFYKLALPFDEETLSEYAEKFWNHDETVPLLGEYDSKWVDQLRKDFETYHRAYCYESVDGILSYSSPRPGPGTFSGKSLYERSSSTKWYTRAHTDYNYPKAFANWSWASRPRKCAPAAELAEDPQYSEVLFVPKDSRGPRTIVREPFALLRYHMAYNKFLSDKLEHATEYRVNFQSQQVNKILAGLGSVTGEFSTIDLANASDSVSTAIVSHIFRYCPGLSTFVNSRCQSAKDHTGKISRIRKLAGMGSGLTFPTMSLLIHLTICRGIVNRYGIPYREAQRCVYVYGDDIIVPTRFHATALSALSKVNLHVNHDKSYYRGPFRESCGGDYLRGQDVTPVRLRLSNSQVEYKRNSKTLVLRGPSSYLQLERHCRELVEHGILGLSNYFYSILEQALGILPQVYGDSPILGRFCLQKPEYNTDDTGMYELVKARIPVPKAEPCEQDYHLFLASKLKAKSKAYLERLLYPDSGGSTYGEVNVPRTVKLRHARVSALRLVIEPTPEPSHRAVHNLHRWLRKIKN